MSALTSFHAEIKNILEQARGKAYSAVNAAMVEAYWLIGRRIVEEEQLGQHKAQYGTRLIEDLSAALTAEFGKGFSYANLIRIQKTGEPDILQTSDGRLPLSVPIQNKRRSGRKLVTLFDLAVDSSAFGMSGGNGSESNPERPGIRSGYSHAVLLSQGCLTCSTF